MQKHIRKFRHKNPDDDVSKEWKSVSDMAISVEKTALLNEIIARSIGKLGMSLTSSTTEREHMCIGSVPIDSSFVLSSVG